jgi:hypothetical protein
MTLRTNCLVLLFKASQVEEVSEEGDSEVEHDVVGEETPSD